MVEDILSYSDTYMPFFALLIFLFNRKKMEKPEKIFIIYLIVNLVLFGITNIMANYKINNLFLYHFYYLFELVFVTFYISRYLIKAFKPLFYVITACYALFWLLDVVLWEPLNVFSSYGAGLEKIIILFLCMYYMLILSKSEEIIKFQKLPHFWMASGFLVSSALGILAVVAYKYYGETSQAVGIHTWTIESIGTIIKFTFISIAFLCYKHPRRFPYQSLTLL
jgi:hypothetical protein